MERLEEVKQTLKYPNHTEHNGQEEIFYMVSERDFKYLIEQSEKVDKLKKRNSRYADKIIKLKELIKDKTLDLIFYHNEVLQRYYVIKDENKSLKDALEKITETYIYGQSDSNGEVMVEVEDTCDSMYHVAEYALKNFTNSK